MEDEIREEPDYDPGLLNGYGGGNVDWWMNYIRSEINSCNAYWRDLIDSYLDINEEEQ